MNVQKYTGGFTIVELMLFVAITALMVVTLLTGWSININTQSYKDAARSLTVNLQGEYTNATSVINDRSAQYSCASDGTRTTITAVEAGSGQSRGASDCIIMGRYIAFQGTTLKSGAIVGIEPATAIPVGTSDKQAMLDYKPTRVDPAVFNEDTYQIPWIDNTYLSKANPTSLHFAVVIVRSPVTGTVYTYTQDIAATTSDPPAAAVITSGLQTARTICLDPGAIVAQPRTAVVIAANAASPNAVSVSADPAATGC